MDYSEFKVWAKKRAYYCVLVLFYSFLVYSPFLREHWVHDTYCISMYGYKYIKGGLFSQGRIISYLYYCVLELINMPYAITMFISVSLSLLFLSSATLLVFYLADKYSGKPVVSCNDNSLLAFLGSVSIFFNIFILDSFMFYENAVMSLGVLLSVVSCWFFVQGKKTDYCMSLALLIISVFCYQADIAYFFPLTLIFIGFRHKSELKSILIRGFWAGIFYIIAILTNYFFLNTIISSQEDRFAGNKDYVKNIKNCFVTITRFMQNNYNHTRNYLFLTFIVVFIAILAYVAVKHCEYITLLILCTAFISIFVCALLPHVAMNTAKWYVMPRSTVAMAGMPGLIMISISMLSTRPNKWFLCVFMMFVYMVSQKQIDMQKNSYASNKLDEQELTYIVNEIKRYETESVFTIKDIYFTYDEKTTWSRETLNSYGDLTVRALANSWMVEPMLQRFLNRGTELSVNVMKSEDRERLFSNKDWNELLYEQLVFEGDTLYLCIY